jgi:hypothetical protein
VLWAVITISSPSLVSLMSHSEPYTPKS